MGRPKNIANLYDPPKSRTQFSEGHKSKGILDDHAVRQNLASKEGTIEHIPTNDNHIVNKLYVDGEISGKTWLQATNQTGLTGDKTGSFDLTTTGDIQAVGFTIPTSSIGLFEWRQAGNIIALGFADHEDVMLIKQNSIGIAQNITNDGIPTLSFGTSGNPFGTAFFTTLDLGTNTITDGVMTGDWDFGTGDLTTTGTGFFGNILKSTNTGGSANFIADRTDGMAAGLLTGSAASVFQYDENGAFEIASQTHAKVVAGDSGSHTDRMVIDTSGNFDFQAGDLTTTGLGTFGNLDVDTLNFNGNVISDSTGQVLFTNSDVRINDGKKITLAKSGNPAMNFLPFTSGVATIETASGSTRTLSFRNTGGGVFLDITMDGDLDVDGDVDIGGDLFFTGDSSGLPYGEVFVNDNTTVTSVSNSGFTQFLHFDTNGHSNLSTPDHTNDHITIVKAGVYMVECCVNIKNSSGAAHVIEVVIAKNDGATIFPNMRRHRTLGTGTDVGAIPICGHLDLAVDDTIELWVTSDSASARDVTAEDVVLMITQVGGT